MSPARWDRAPRTPKARKKRRPVMRGRWRCRRCGDIIDGTFASAQRHADTHGGARLEQVIDDGGEGR